MTAVADTDTAVSLCHTMTACVVEPRTTTSPQLCHLASAECPICLHVRDGVIYCNNNVTESACAVPNSSLCVSPRQPTTTTVVTATPVTIGDEKNESSIGLVVGLAAAAVVTLGLVVWCCVRSHRRARLKRARQLSFGRSSLHSVLSRSDFFDQAVLDDRHSRRSAGSSHPPSPTTMMHRSPTSATLQYTSSGRSVVALPPNAARPDDALLRSLEAYVLHPPPPRLSDNHSTSTTTTDRLVETSRSFDLSATDFDQMLALKATYLVDAKRKSAARDDLADRPRPIQLT
ncbi:Aste57867_419 [Aphanomyces stellatus]|uniref:Aste57867_419 protein n=1 Tax=Aphanomyces stellatus TaxID=120398 RepID=A0A485K6P7_9STRA|nr:hypothetical protein As57867_000418 [Aphanomyces stellatus]VFT77644.1 Aste57867_419 [Aphanomyces stellatus]